MIDRYRRLLSCLPLSVGVEKRMSLPLEPSDTIGLSDHLSL